MKSEKRKRKRKANGKSLVDKQIVSEIAVAIKIGQIQGSVEGLLEGQHVGCIAERDLQILALQEGQRVVHQVATYLLQLLSRLHRKCGSGDDD